MLLVFEDKRRHRFLSVGAAQLFDIACAPDFLQESKSLRSVIGIDKIERPHQGGAVRQLCEMMKVKYSLTEPVYSDLKPRTIERERIIAKIPLFNFVKRW